VVDNKNIADNSYKLDVSGYVIGEDTRETVNISELNAEIARIVIRQNELRKSIDEIVADIEGK
jgi:type I restriction enzyme M protein